MMKVAQELKRRRQELKILSDLRGDIMAKAFDDLFDGADNTSDKKDLAEVEAEITKKVAEVEAEITKKVAELDAWRIEHQVEISKWYADCGAHINPKWRGDGHDTVAKWVVKNQRESWDGAPYTCDEDFDELKALGI